MNRKEFLQLFGGAAFVFANRVIGAGAVFATQILLARWMGATEVGIYVYAFSLFNLLAILAGLGLSSSALKFIGQGLAHGEHGAIVGIARIGMQIVLFSGLCFAVVGEIVIHESHGLIPQNYIQALALAMACIPAMCLMNWQSTIAQCLNWVAAAFFPSNVARPVLLVAAIVLMQQQGQHLDAATVMLLQFGTMVLLWLLSSIYTERKVSKRFMDAKPRYQVGCWVRTGLPLLFIALFSNFFLDINIVAVGWYLTPDQLAIFNASFRVAVLIAFGIQSIDAILLPRFTRLYAAKELVKLQRLITLTTQLKFWSSLCGVIIFVVWGRAILSYFGKEFVQGYNALLILGISQLIRAAVGPVSQMLSLTGHHAYCLSVSILSTLLMLGLNYFLINRFGLMGAAYTVILVIALESFLLSITTVKELGINASVFSLFSSNNRFGRVF